MHSKQIKKIQKLLKFWKSSQPLNEHLQRSIDNTLTYGQTKLLLLFGRVEGKGLMRDFEETDKKQQKTPSNVPVNVLLSDTEKYILKLISDNSRITYGEIAKEMYMNRKTAQQSIEKLKNSGLFARVDADKNGYWKIN